MLIYLKIFNGYLTLERVKKVPGIKRDDSYNGLVVFHKATGIHGE